MIRFSALGRNGQTVLGLGLSHGNLDRLRNGEPIMFPLAEYGLDGDMVILWGDLALVAQTEAAIPHARVVGLTSQTLDTLRSGQILDLPSTSTGFPMDLMLFAGATELEIIEAMEQGALVSKDTELVGLEAYHRHGSNRVSDCPECRARSRQELLEWVFSHPWLIVLAVVAFVMALGLILESL